MNVRARLLKLPGEIADRVRVDFTDQELTSMAARYEDGETSHQLAKSFATSTTTVLNRLRSLGVKLRSAGRQMMLTDEQITEVKRYREAGKSWGFLGKKYGVSPNTVRRTILQGETT